MVGSMSGVGSAGDNAAMESSWLLQKNGWPRSIQSGGRLSSSDGLGQMDYFGSDLFFRQFPCEYLLAGIGRCGLRCRFLRPRIWPTNMGAGGYGGARGLRLRPRGLHHRPPCFPVRAARSGSLAFRRCRTRTVLGRTANPKMGRAGKRRPRGASRSPAGSCRGRHWGRISVDGLAQSLARREGRSRSSLPQPVVDPCRVDSTIALCCPLCQSGRLGLCGTRQARNLRFRIRQRTAPPRPFRLAVRCRSEVPNGCIRLRAWIRRSLSAVRHGLGRAPLDRR